jgi:hypothetical protein
VQIIVMPGEITRIDRETLLQQGEAEEEKAEKKELFSPSSFDWSYWC